MSTTRIIASRPLTTRFHIEVIHYSSGEIGINIVKTTNGDVVDPEEPLMLVRARDVLAIPLLLCYRALICAATYPDEEAKKEHLESNYRLVSKFGDWALKFPERMKLPNVTRGK
jgi:hypothetical protein